MAAPLVYVILPVHNRETWVGRAIDSVLAQTYQPIEVIVVDDGSTDGTGRILERFGDQITILTQPHAGAYVARNLGIRHARGELVAFIDSDDAWLPDKLTLQVPLTHRAALVYGDAIHMTAERTRRRRTCFRVSPPQRGRVAAGFAWANFVPTTTVLVRRRCLDEAGGFSEASEISSDSLLWFRIALRHELDYVDRPVAEYTVHDAGISYDLGCSLAARIQLFSDELSQATDPETRLVLRRLLFNLSLRLVLAYVRGLARNVSHPLRLARRTASRVARVEAIPWAAAFAARELRLRTARLLS